MQVRGLCPAAKTTREMALPGYPPLLQEDSGGRLELHVLRPRPLLPLHQRQPKGGDRPPKRALRLHRQPGGGPMGYHATPFAPDPLPDRLPRLVGLCQNDRVGVRQVHGLWLPVSEYSIFSNLGADGLRAELDCSRVTASTQSTC